MALLKHFPYTAHCTPYRVWWCFGTCAHVPSLVKFRACVHSYFISISPRISQKWPPFPKAATLPKVSRRERKWSRACLSLGGGRVRGWGGSEGRGVGAAGERLWRGGSIGAGPQEGLGRSPPACRASAPGQHAGQGLRAMETHRLLERTRSRNEAFIYLVDNHLCLHSSFEESLQVLVKVLGAFLDRVLKFLQFCF